MNQQQNPAMVAKIVWGALCMSLLVYGVALFFTGKLTSIALPTTTERPIEMLALMAPTLLLVTLFMYRTQVPKAKTHAERFPKQIICWALNESVAMLGFVATFLSPEGNGYFAIANIAAALVANILMFPKE